jgi:hypothetical protein
MALANLHIDVYVNFASKQRVEHAIIDKKARSFEFFHMPIKFFRRPHRTINRPKGREIRVSMDSVSVRYRLDYVL